ncbi:YHS domain-containing protein [Prosthecobacter fusiformis]|uniref:YHS domain-containing protein n=1 Tax=Prosthecobacter fusiformis TaxID=48464 RepID=A0A4R7SQ12_9BACT|nr:YHS domain-containing protein [Prosthecobacter fusiformis]TDU81014.1 YHS domain-containing protein [Prosthecobacter fusiformis]
MKTLFSILALSAMASFAAAAPVNTECPVKEGKPVKAELTTTHKGKEIAFCCKGCVNKFKADPEKYEKNLK